MTCIERGGMQPPSQRSARLEALEVQNVPAKEVAYHIARAFIMRFLSLLNLPGLKACFCVHSFFWFTLSD